MSKRKQYLLATIIILLFEVLIALFVHDSIIRPYVGDVLVVIVLYTFVRCLLPEGCRLLPWYIFLFAMMVEILQCFKIVELLGLQDNRFFSVLIGTVFDIKDIICYGVGCLLLGSFELIIWKKSKN